MTTPFPTIADGSDRRTLVAAVGTLLLGVVLIRTAWLSDDAYITLRTIDNFVNGYGLRWNVAERVQSFTHPGWLMVLTPFYALTREPFYTTLAVQCGTSLLTAYLLMRYTAVHTGAALFAVAVLVSSKALIDFSTGGLENPLTHLLLLTLYLVWRHPGVEPRIGTLCALASLLMLARQDLLILVVPVVATALLASRPVRFGRAALGLAPVVAWHVFSLIYYGSFVPTTALAKVFTGVPAVDLLHQGLRYWTATLTIDPVTVVLQVGAGLALVVVGGAPGRIMALGAGAYAAYVTQVGGDFMSGRFFTPILFWLLLGVVGLTPNTRAWRLRFPLAAAGVLAFGLAAPAPAPLVSGATFGPLSGGDEAVMYFGVADERRYYYATMGLLPRLARRDDREPNTWAQAGLEARARGQAEVMAASSVGFFGYHAGPRVHIVDRNALCDPLLARLPAKPAWRIGHFQREIPEGYLETLRQGENRLTDARLRPFYDVLREVTRGPIWSWSRLRLGLGLALGRVHP